MNLKNKIAVNSTLLFAFTIGLVMIGSFLLFRTHIKDLYYQNLENKAMITALLHLEKDQIIKTDSARYQRTESQNKEISNEFIRIYNAQTKKLYLKDNITINIGDKDLDAIIKNKIKFFTIDKRQFAGLFYKNKQGEFIIVTSGIDYAGNYQLNILGLIFILFYLAGITIHYLLGRFLVKQTIERLENGILLQNNFLKNASHELKTPLTIIIGDIDVTLQKPRTNEEYQEVLKSLRKDTVHFKSILQQLSILSGLELSESEQIESVRIDEILWNVIEKKTIKYPESKVWVNFDAIANHENLLSVIANKDMLFIALDNILDNAIKFSMPTQVDVVAFANEGKLLLKIIDRGFGIAENDKKSIFNPFFRSNHTRHIKGLGLGLFITMQILKRYNIMLTIDSEIAKGTIVSLLFPLNHSKI